MTKRWTIVKNRDEWLLPLSGRQVDRCTLDYRFSLEFFDEDEQASIVIGTVFSVFEHMRVFEMNTADPAQLGPACALVRRVVRTARATKTGRLEILFEDESRLIVEPNEQLEAWEMHGPQGTRAVCMPKGDVAVWNAEDGTLGA